MKDLPPPQSLEMEQAVIGSMLVDESTIAAVSRILSVSDFHRDAHRLIFESILRLNANGSAVDVLTVQDELASRNKIEAAGGGSYLLALADKGAVSSRVESHAKVVAEKSVLRKLLAFSGVAASLATQPYEELSDVLYKAEEELMKISRSYRGVSRNEIYPVEKFAHEFHDRLEYVRENGGKIPGIRTGLTDIDYMLGALEPGLMSTVGGKPGAGKTAFAMNVALNAAKEGKTVVIFSMEMTGFQIYRRLLSPSGMLPMMQLRTGQLTGEQFDTLGKQTSQINAMPIYICESSTETPTSIAAKLRAVEVTTKIDLLIVDFLQLMPTHGGNRAQEVGENAKGIKRIAKDTGCHALLLSQVSRAGYDEPNLKDLRESGDIEAVSDYVMLLWQKSEGLDDPDMALIGAKVAKSKDGATDTSDVWFDKKCLKFYDVDHRK